ncbi:MAG TPA: hypothetical protein VLU25_15305 [Acidobacteriota bacterium]|nr:hypothetical protein [Acidobacteriota bacterium]
MIRKLFVVLASGLAMTAILSAQTVDEVVAKIIDAQGGKEVFMSIDTSLSKGKMIFQGGAASGELRIYQKRPNLVRFELDVAGTTLIQAHDGEDAWKVVPAVMQGTGKPEAMTERERRDFLGGAHIDPLLIDYQEKGHEVELVGTEDMEGTEVYHLKVTHNNGRVFEQYYDTETGLLIKNITMTYNPQLGQDLEMTQYMGDYKDVGGMMIAHSVEAQVMGQTAFQIVFEEFVANPDLDDSMFSRPAEEE